MTLRSVFSFFSNPFRHKPVEGVGEPKAGAPVNIVLCNDSGSLQDDAKAIARHLRAFGHDIKITCIDDQKGLLKYLAKLKRKGKPPPDGFFLDVGGVGSDAALEVIKWYDENYPSTPLPEISFLSLGLHLGIHHAGLLHEMDSRVRASFVDRYELN
jgi:hypothetical protein